MKEKLSTLVIYFILVGVLPIVTFIWIVVEYINYLFVTSHFNWWSLATFVFSLIVGFTHHMLILIKIRKYEQK